MLRTWAFITSLFIATSAWVPPCSAAGQFEAVVERLLEKAPPSSSPPQLVFIIGGIGSGKSSIRNQLMSLGYLPPDQFFVIDIDEVRESSPLFNQMKAKYGIETAIQESWEETLTLLDELRESAMRRRVNIVIDQSMRNRGSVDWAIRMLGEFPEYRPSLIRVDTPEPMAIQRVEQRKLESGRGAASDKVVRASRRGSAEAAEALTPVMESTMLISNASEPTLVSIDAAGERRLFNQPLREGLLAYGEGTMPVSGHTYARKSFNGARKVQNSSTGCPEAFAAL